MLSCGGKWTGSKSPNESKKSMRDSVERNLSRSCPTMFTPNWKAKALRVCERRREACSGNGCWGIKNSWAWRRHFEKRPAGCWFSYGPKWRGAAVVGRASLKPAGEERGEGG